MPKPHREALSKDGVNRHVADIAAALDVAAGTGGPDQRRLWERPEQH